MLPQPPLRSEKQRPELAMFWKQRLDLPVARRPPGSHVRGAKAAQPVTAISRPMITTTIGTPFGDAMAARARLAPSRPATVAQRVEQLADLGHLLAAAASQPSSKIGQRGRR